MCALRRTKHDGINIVMSTLLAGAARANPVASTPVQRRCSRQHACAEEIFSSGPSSEAPRRVGYFFDCGWALFHVLHKLRLHLVRRQSGRVEEPRGGRHAGRACGVGLACQAVTATWCSTLPSTTNSVVIT